MYPTFPGAVRLDCLCTVLALADELSRQPHLQAGEGPVHHLALIDAEGWVRHLERSTGTAQGLLEYGACLAANDPAVTGTVLLTVGHHDVSGPRTPDDVELLLLHRSAASAPLLDWIQADADSFRSLAFVVDPEDAWHEADLCDVGEAVRAAMSNPFDTRGGS